MHFNGLPATKVIDDRYEGNGEWAIGLDKLLFPIAAAKSDSTHLDAMLLQHER